MIAAIEGIISVGKRLAAASLAVALVGCGGGFNYSGTWIGRREVKVPAGADETIYNTFSKVELTVSADGEFELMESALPKSGKLITTGNGARLKVEYIFGKTVATQGKEVAARNREILLEPQPDGTLIFTDPGDFDPKPVRLSRKPKP